MQLKSIDKARYNKHIKIVFAGIVVFLLGITLAASTLIIQFFGTKGESHFWFNLLGLVIAMACITYMLTKLRRHPFMYEIVYVWDLKKILNRIYRKQRKIEKNLENNNHDAMIIINYQNRGSKQLYELDDNTITLTELNSKIKQLDIRMKAAGLKTSTDAFNIEMLEKY